MYDSILLLGNVRCHLRMMDEGSFDEGNSMSAMFEVIGSPNFSSASRLTLTVSSKSSKASDVSSVILG